MTSITSSGLETKRSVQPWRSTRSEYCSTAVRAGQSWAGTFTNGTLFLSSWTARLVLETETRLVDQQTETWNTEGDERQSSHRPEGLWSCPGKSQSRKPAEGDRVLIFVSSCWWSFSILKMFTSENCKGLCEGVSSENELEVHQVNGSLRHQSYGIPQVQHLPYEDVDNMED